MMSRGATADGVAHSSIVIASANAFQTIGDGRSDDHRLASFRLPRQWRSA
jgi:hypothetical protein